MRHIIQHKGNVATHRRFRSQTNQHSTTPMSTIRLLQVTNPTTNTRRRSTHIVSHQLIMTTRNHPHNTAQHRITIISSLIPIRFTHVGTQHSRTRRRRNLISQPAQVIRKRTPPRYNTHTGTQTASRQGVYIQGHPFVAVIGGSAVKHHGQANPQASQISHNNTTNRTINFTPNHHTKNTGQQ